MGKQLFDQYSYLHFASGIIAYFWNFDLRTWMILHTVFELFENTKIGMKTINLITFWPGGKNYSDSLVNILGDTIAGFIGWYTAYLLDKKGSERNWFNQHLNS